MRHDSLRRSSPSVSCGPTEPRKEHRHERGPHRLLFRGVQTGRRPVRTRRSPAGRTAGRHRALSRLHRGQGPLPAGQRTGARRGRLRGPRVRLQGLGKERGTAYPAWLRTAGSRTCRPPSPSSVPRKRWTRTGSASTARAMPQCGSDACEEHATARTKTRQVVRPAAAQPLAAAAPPMPVGATSWIQPKGSGRVPYWMPISSSKSRSANGPVPPFATCSVRPL